jgi:hypothetical protein
MCIEQSALTGLIGNLVKSESGPAAVSLGQSCEYSLPSDNDFPPSATGLRPGKAGKSIGKPEDLLCGSS